MDRYVRDKVRNSLSQGDIKRIAALSGHHYTSVSNWLNFKVKRSEKIESAVKDVTRESISIQISELTVVINTHVDRVGQLNQLLTLLM